MSEVLYDPEQITTRSYEYIDRNLPDIFKEPRRRQLARRVVHTSGDLTLAKEIRFHRSPVSRGDELLDDAVTVVADVSMVEAGLRSSLIDRLDVKTFSYVHAEGVARQAEEKSITRSAAGLDKALENHDSFILLVGNAPTVIHRLIERAVPVERIPLVVGVPVGFIGVREAKEKLLSSPYPSVVIEGSRGGSPLAASIMNALMQIHLGEAYV